MSRRNTVGSSAPGRSAGRSSVEVVEARRKRENITNNFQKIFFLNF